MVTEWSKLGFLIRNPFLKPVIFTQAGSGDFLFVSIEKQQS
jgi:hypothetical protein